MVLQVVDLSPGWYVQFTPSGEVAHLPESPTATNTDPFQVIARATTLPQVVEDSPGWYVHVTPSGEVAHFPEVPATTNTDPFHARA